MSAVDDDFLSGLHVDDAGVTFADDLGGGEDALPRAAAEAPVLTPEQELAEARKQLARYKSLDAIADALERDPGKIYEVRDALDGKRREAGFTEHTPPPKPQGPKTILEAVKAMTPDQRAAFDSMEPIEREAAMADLGRQLAYQDFANASQPVIDASVASAIRDFKLSHASEPIYRHAEAHFDQEMSDFDKKTFYQLSDSQRQRQLSLRWSAAKAAAYDAAAAKAPARQSPRNIGGGGGAGGGGQLRAQAPSASNDLKELAARSGLKPGQLEAIMREAANS